jgi:hypothetical protein
MLSQSHPTRRFTPTHPALLPVMGANHCHVDAITSGGVDALAIVVDGRGYLPTAHPYLIVLFNYCVLRVIAKRGALDYCCYDE